MGIYDDVELVIPTPKLDISALSTNNQKQWKDLLGTSGLQIFRNSQLMDQEKRIHDKYLRIQERINEDDILIDKEGLRRKLNTLKFIYAEIIQEIIYRKNGVVKR